MSWSKTYSFSPSTTISSAEVNKNFDDCINAVNAAMPSGIIVMWNGSIASIPSGFYLCNGSNGTSDLRDKFIVGAGSTYAVDATGGEATHALTEAELAVHKHTVAYHESSTSGAGYIGGGDASSTNRTEDTSNTGSGTAHNNLPPYFSKAFIQKS